MLSSIDDVITNVNKVSSEISGKEILEDDVPMTNGKATADDDDDVIEIEKKSMDASLDRANGVNDANDASAEENAENVDVAEIMDFIANISDKVQKAMEVEENEVVETLSNIAPDSNGVSNDALTNGFESTEAPDTIIQDNAPAAEVDKSSADDKIVLDDDNIEISDDGNPSEADIVDITSDDEDRLLTSDDELPTSKSASKPKAETISENAIDPLIISNDIDMKDEEPKSPALNETAERKTSKSSQISSVVIDIDDDEDEEATETPKASSIIKDKTINLDDDDEEGEKSDKTEAENADKVAIAEKAIDEIVASITDISTIDLDDDDEEEGKKSDVENADEIATSPKTIDECVAHDDDTANVTSELSKPTDAEEPMELSSSELLIVESKESADSNEAPVAKIPVAESVTEKEKQIIAAIDQDIDQGNNLLEEMIDVPISNGGSSEGSSSANEDDDMDPNHFASDDIILLPYDDEASKSSVCFELTKEASSTNAATDDAICVDSDEKTEASCIQTEGSSCEPASIEKTDSVEIAAIADGEPNEKVDENLEQENVIDSTDTTPVEEEASKENTSTEITKIAATICVETESHEKESLSTAVKTKLDVTENDEIQPEAKKPRVDSPFDLLKEAESTSVEKTVPGTEAKSESESSAAEIVDAAAVVDVPATNDEEDLVLIGTIAKSTDVIPTGSKRPAPSDLSEESDTKKLKISEGTETDSKVEPDGVIDGTAASTDTTDTIIRASTPTLKLTPEPTKPEQKQTLALDFLKKFKKQFDQMTKTDLEDLVLEKIVEAIVHKSEYSDLRNKTNAQEQVIQSLRVKVQELSKQYRDLEMVHSRVVKDLETRNQNVISPVKITRAVGLQVCLTKKDTSSSTVQPTTPVSRTPSTSQQPSKEELARRAAMVLQQQKLQKMQRQAIVNKHKMEQQEDITKKNRLSQQRAAEVNKNVRLLHNQQLRMKAQLQQSQQNKIVSLLPKATTVTVAQTPPLRKSLPMQQPQIT